MLNREEAYMLLRKYTSKPFLLRHALSVEAVMRRFAELTNHDVEYWGIVGLLHDIDYEKWPKQHCKKAQKLLHEAGFDEAFIHAVVCHGYGLVTNVEPELQMEKVLYTIDELTGLVSAAALMRPSKSVLDMEVKSLKKKFKDKTFAAKVDRSVIQNGCNMLGMSLDEVMLHTLEGMQTVADEIGLKGNA